MMTTANLQNIADRMRASIDATGGRGRGTRARRWVTETLPGGLAMVLQREDVAGRLRYRLALRRENVQPSDSDLAICARVFGVPPGWEPFRFRMVRRNVKTHSRMQYEVLEVRWYEQGQSVAEG